MVHRAILGSLERFFGLLLEHFAGKFPVWLAPVQVAVLPITDRCNDRAAEVTRSLRQVGLRVELDNRSEKIGAKIRQAQLRKIPYMVILGDREVESGTLAVRTRRKVTLGAFPWKTLLAVSPRKFAGAPSPLEKMAVHGAQSNANSAWSDMDVALAKESSYRRLIESKYS